MSGDATAAVLHRPSRSALTLPTPPPRLRDSVLIYPSSSRIHFPQHRSFPIQPPSTPGTPLLRRPQEREAHRVGAAKRLGPGAAGASTALRQQEGGAQGQEGGRCCGGHDGAAGVSTAPCAALPSAGPSAPTAPTPPSMGVAAVDRTGADGNTRPPPSTPLACSYFPRPSPITRGGVV